MYISRSRTNPASLLSTESITETIFTNQNNDRLLEIYFSHMQLQSQISTHHSGPSHHHAPFLSVNLTGYNYMQVPQVANKSNNAKKQQQRIEHEKKDGTFLQYSFFIFEESDDKELDTEDDRMAEKLLYFYPSEGDEEINGTNFPKNVSGTSGSFNNRKQSFNKKTPKPSLFIPLGKRKAVGKDEQLMIVGFIQAYIYFCRHFEPNDSEIELIRFKNSKMGIRKIGNMYLCLCLPQSTPDGAVRSQCQHLFDTMTFFHGSLDRIKDRMESRVEYEFYIKQMGADLLPLLRGFHDKPSLLFDLVPYTELPPKCNSLFIQAHHVLESLHSDLAGYLGGAVSYEQSILCTQLDEDLLKFLLYKNQLINEHNNSNLGGAPDNSHSPSGSPPSQLKPFEESLEDAEWVNINPDNERTRLQHLRSQLILDMMNEEAIQHPVTRLSHAEIFSRVRKYIIFNADDRVALFPVYLSKAKLESLQKEFQSDDESIDEQQGETDSSGLNNKAETDQKEDGEYVCLVIFQLGRVTLSLLLNLKHAIKGSTISQMRTLTRDRLKTLERKIVQYMVAASSQSTISELVRSNSSNGSSPSASIPIQNAMPRGTITIDDDFNSEAPHMQQPYVLKDGIRIKYNINNNSTNSSGVGSPALGGEGLSFEDNLRTSNPNAMIYDSYSRMLTSNSTNEGFILRSSVTHECFKRDKTISKMFLKNATGYLYSRRMFGTELFYHQMTPIPASAIKTPEYVFIDQLENNVRSCMRREFLINLL